MRATPTPAAPMSHENAEEMCALAAAATGLKAADFVVASTGVIGQTLNIAAIARGVPAAAAALSRSGSGDAANAIMTTDTVKKEAGRRPWPLDGQKVHHRRHRQGHRHDSPQHGHHAVLPHHRLRHYPGNASGGPPGYRAPTPSTGSPWTGTPPPTTCASSWPTAWREIPLIEWKDENYSRVFQGPQRDLHPSWPGSIAADGEGRHLVW